MEHIDFWKEKNDLHKRIIQAICDLMVENEVTEIDFEKYGDNIDKPYACIFTDGGSVEVGVRKLRMDGCFEILPENSEGIFRDDQWFDLSYDVLYCTIDTVYDAVWQVLDGGK